MEKLTGVIKTEEGFLEGVSKQVFVTEDKTWVEEGYVLLLEEEFEKMLTLTKDALKLAALSREKKNNPPQDT